MAFRFLHSSHDATPISIPWIGLDLRVRVPPHSTGGALTSIETTNAPGFGPPLHRHREAEIFYVLKDGTCSRWMAGASMPKRVTS